LTQTFWMVVLCRYFNWFSSFK